MLNSKKALQEAFRSASFDPRKPGPMTAIVACNDPDYLAKRAEEFLRDSARFEGSEKFCRLRDAVAIIAYAMTLLPRGAEVLRERSAHKPCHFCSHAWGYHSDVPMACTWAGCSCGGYVDPDRDPK